MVSRRERHEAEWTRDELAFIDTHADMPLDEMAEALGKDRRAVFEARKRVGSSTMGDPWTVEDDALVLATPNLTAAQVGRHLGRTTDSVQGRRKILSRTKGAHFGLPGHDKSPLTIGARPLIAKTCTKCGLLLPSDWFTWFARQNGTGGWKPSCKKCNSAAVQARTAKNPARTQDKDRRAVTKQRSKRALQAMTTPTADRSGQPWLDVDHEVLKDPDLTLLEKALHLKRTYHAVRRQVLGTGLPLARRPR